MIGGGGETKTLRTVAKYADIWNAFGDLATLRHKIEVLREHCAAVGRDPATIQKTVSCKMVIRDDPAEAQRAWEALMAANNEPHYSDDPPWLGPPQQIADTLRGYLAAGFDGLMVELPAPHDVETIERLIGEVRPTVRERCG